MMRLLNVWGGPNLLGAKPTLGKQKVFLTESEGPSIAEISGGDWAEQVDGKQSHHGISPSPEAIPYKRDRFLCARRGA